MDDEDYTVQITEKGVQAALDIYYKTTELGWDLATAAAYYNLDEDAAKVLLVILYDMADKGGVSLTEVPEFPQDNG